MKNITISMDEELAHLTRIEAAKAGLSMSKFIAETVAERLKGGKTDEVRRNRQREALERVLAGPKWDVTENGRMPTADERNARR